jgi:hypothetical protein
LPEDDVEKQKHHCRIIEDQFIFWYVVGKYFPARKKTRPEIKVHQPDDIDQNAGTTNNDDKDFTHDDLQRCFRR